MMKWILSALILWVVQSHAYEGFHCVPSERDTRFQALVEGDQISVLVVNPMGYEFMPQFEGPLSIFNFSFNKMQGDDLKGLGESFKMEWPKESCQLDAAHFTLSCHGEPKATVNGIKPLSVTTTEVTEKYEGTVYEKRKFRLTLEQSNIYFVTLQFDLKSCEKFN